MSGGDNNNVLIEKCEINNLGGRLARFIPKSAPIFSLAVPAIAHHIAKIIKLLTGIRGKPFAKF